MASFECPAVWLAVVRPRRRARPLDCHGAARDGVVLVVADVAVAVADLGAAALVVGVALVLGVASSRDVGAATL
eukprot:4988399-Pyramimonas_sp.AAC.1